MSQSVKTMPASSPRLRMNSISYVAQTPKIHRHSITASTSPKISSPSKKYTSPPSAMRPSVDQSNRSSIDKSSFHKTTSVRQSIKPIPERKTSFTDKKTPQTRPKKTPVEKPTPIKRSKLFSTTQAKIQITSKRLKWVDQKLPLTSSYVLKNFGDHLLEYEKMEISQFNSIYYIGDKLLKRKYILQQGTHNIGFDDSKGNLVVHKSDHIGYRYELHEMIGSGAFGQVYRVFDHKVKEFNAMKIIRSNKECFQQSLVEVRILKHIKELDPEDQFNLVQIKDFVIFRNHVCLIFELLSLNLYDMMRLNLFKGLKMDNIKKIAIQLLQSLLCLKQASIIHCDVKPENILLTNEQKSGVKLVDFGSACFSEEKKFTYFQSRFYRAPEVILGHKYDFGIDIWSLGLVLVELYLGYPLCSGQNEQEQLANYMAQFGFPPLDFLEKSTRTSKYFDSYMKPLFRCDRRSQNFLQNTQVDLQFREFIQACCIWDPQRRLTPEMVTNQCDSKGLIHPWILKGLPTDVETQHLIRTQISAKNLDLEDMIRSSLHRYENQKKTQRLQSQTFH